MRVPGWLDDTRTSYDTVAVSYADLLRDALAGEGVPAGLTGALRRAGARPGERAGR